VSTDVDVADASRGRQERRKARTRRALVDAAVRLVAAGRAEQATIHEITEEADLGFGTFYNHFASKDELFGVAAREALEHWGRALDVACGGIDDPVESFAARFRISGRVGRTHPELARFLTELGLAALTSRDGLAPRARRDLDAAFAAGRLHHGAPEVALSTVAGALIGMLQLQLHTPGGVSDTVVDEVTAGVLRLLGAAPDDADEVASRPLPEARFGP
jgi:AcrR family transcriptional regulator